MSWFLGYIGNDYQKILSTLSNKSKNCCKHFVDEDLCLVYSDSINASHNLDSKEKKKINFFVSGLGILPGEERQILEKNHWEEKFLNEFCFDIDGHFASVSFNRDKVSLITDQLGLRDIYYTVTNSNQIIFSTRIDLLLQFKSTEIDFETFGSRWTLFNQISPKSIFKGISRLTSGNVLTIDRADKKFFIKMNNWLPNHKEEKLGSPVFSQTLQGVLPIQYNSSNIYLALSGGLDSRVLFLMLLNKVNNKFLAFTFGKDDSADVSIAKKLADEFNIPHTIINQAAPSFNLFWNDLQHYSLMSTVNNSATSLLHLQNYDSLQIDNGIVIDGGFGEIWRREFFYKLFFYGKKLILEKRINEIVPYLKYFRADVFNNDIVEIMNRGIIDELEQIFVELPDAKEIGVENWIDLFAIKTRLTNYYAHEQNILDMKISGYMPYVQISLLNKLFQFSASQKKDGRLFKNIVKSNHPIFASMNLAKGETTLPSYLNSFSARAYSLALKKFGKLGKKIPERFDYLIANKQSVLEILESKQTADCCLYNKTMMNLLIDNCKSQTADANCLFQIDWLLAFESFRRQIYN